MSTFKSFFLNRLILLVFVALGVIGGCLGDQGCGNSCAGGLFCPTSREECECVAGQRGCNKFSFNENKQKCSISGCRKCALLVGRCGESGTSQQDITSSEFTAVFSLERDCDVISSADSESDCEDLTIDRECESFEFVSSEEDNLVSQCWLYECEDCLLDTSDFNEDFVE